MSTPGSSALSLQDLARGSGEQTETLLAWRSLGLIGVDGRDDFSPADVEVVRLIQGCLRRGVAIETVSRAEHAEPGFLRRYVEQLFPTGLGPTHTAAEAAALAGLDVSLVRRLREIISPSRPADALDGEDVEVLRGWKVALDNGLPEEALFQLVRVYVDALGRVAEAEARLFHFYVHARMREQGLSGEELRRRTDAASEPMRRLVEPAVLYFHRRAMANALCEDMLLHLAEYAGPAEATAAPAQLRLAIAFLDLASFTPLAESMGDLAAAEVVARFSELVREVVNRHQGRVVERIGDAFMLTFSEPQAAVASVLEIEARAADEHQFPALRGGIHFGRVLYREGGYVGTNVNIAARVAAEAQRNQILVTTDVRRRVAGLPNVDFVPIGKRRLKGLADELELHEARPSREGRSERVTDPVCGMELTRAGIAATLVIEGSELAFCSEACLRTFVDSRKTSGDRQR